MMLTVSLVNILHCLQSYKTFFLWWGRLCCFFVWLDYQFIIRGHNSLCHWEGRRTRSLCTCTHSTFSLSITHWWTRVSLLLRGQEDKVGLRVCAMLALSIHTLMMCMYLLLRGKEDKVTLSVCTHFLYPFTQWRPVRWKRCTRQDTERGCGAPRCLQAGQSLHTLPQSPCGHQSWTPDENFEDLLL